MIRGHLSLGHLWIIGPGRLGLALGSRLLDGGGVDRLTFTGRAPIPPDHPNFRDGAADYSTVLPAAESAPTAILLTVPDRSIPAIGIALADQRLPPVPVLHTSGVLDSGVLEPLRSRGHPTGSLHPLVSIADPLAGAHSLDSAWFAFEGSDDAVDVARAIVAIVKGKGFHVDASEKPVYHAAAVFASNYIVVLLDVAERLMCQAGVDSLNARTALTELASGAIANVASMGAMGALTGPISRGDAATVDLHLRGLSSDLRPLYSELAREAVGLARRQGLDSNLAQRISRMVQAETT